MYRWYMNNVLGVLSRERIELAVPLSDCSGRVYSEDEREDIIRYMLQSAEMQRDEDIYQVGSFVIRNTRIGDE